jgi:hypothetical protein
MPVDAIGVGAAAAGGTHSWVTRAEWDFVAIRSLIGSDHDLVPGTPGAKTNVNFPHDLELKNGTNGLGTLQITANGLEASSSTTSQIEEAILVFRLDDAITGYGAADHVRVVVAGSSNVDDSGDRPPNNSRWGLSIWGDDDASDPNVTLYTRFDGSAAKSFLQRRDGTTGGTNDEAATSPADSEYTLIEADVFGPFVKFASGRGTTLPDPGDLSPPPNGATGTWTQVDDDALVQPGVTPVAADSIAVVVKKATANADTIDVVVTHVWIQRLEAV